MIKIVVFFPFILAFNYKPLLSQWVLSSKDITATRISKYQSLSSLHIACEREKTEALFPANCFRLLNLINEIDSKLDLTEISEQLTNLCVERVDLLTSIYQIEQVEKVLPILGRCRSFFLARKEIVLYKLQK